jgi:hypothetical protein
VPNLALKEQQVVSLADQLSRAKVTVLADYRGLSVSEITTLRPRVRARSIGESNCLECQEAGAGEAGGCHGVRWRSTALRMSKSLCIQATRASFLGLPAASRRS